MKQLQHLIFVPPWWW